MKRVLEQAQYSAATFLATTSDTYFMVHGVSNFLEAVSLPRLETADKMTLLMNFDVKSFGN